MIEFMDEDELLAEFHKAGIWLPEEREAQERAIRAAGRFRELAGAQLQNMAQGRSPFAEALGTQQLYAQQQQRIMETGPNARGGMASIFGGLLGGLLQ